MFYIMILNTSGNVIKELDLKVHFKKFLIDDELSCYQAIWNRN